jgi:Carboxypeptidase regulatory-like domain
MSSENEPKSQQMAALEAYAQRLVRRPPDPKRRKQIRGLIASLMTLVVILSGITLWRSQSVSVFSSQGSIIGSVVDPSGHPVAADVYIERSSVESRSDAAGHFAISGVPVGQQVVVIAHNGIGQEYPVVVTRNGMIDIGVVRVMTTAVPGA